MNPRENAEKLLDGFKINITGELRARVIEVIVAGMAIAAAESAKEEREVCAKIADLEKERHWQISGNGTYSRDYRVIAHQMGTVSAAIADDIRARNKDASFPRHSDEQAG